MSRGVRARLLAVLVFFSLLISACGGQQTAPARETAEQAPAPDGVPQLDYARQLAFAEGPGGTIRIIIGGSDEYLFAPEGTDPGDSGDAVVIRGPLRHIYLAASSAMDSFRALDALSQVRMTSTRENDWSLPEVRSALRDGSLLYIGKYNAPDYEALLAEGCDLAVESTMIWHSPETMETIASLGIPVLVERSSYEPDPLGRLEWIKLYGLLTGRSEEAERFFEEEVSKVLSMAGTETGKTVAFFSISPGGYAVVRKPGDYISRLIDMAGGTYFLPAEEGAEDNALATFNMDMESFYEKACGADVLIYNATIGEQVETMDALIAKSPLLADFEAVKAGNVWCTEKNLFQQTTGLASLCAEIGAVLRGEEREEELTFLCRVKGAEQADTGETD